MSVCPAIQAGKSGVRKVRVGVRVAPALDPLWVGREGGKAILLAGDRYGRTFTPQLLSFCGRCLFLLAGNPGEPSGCLHEARRQRVSSGSLHPMELPGSFRCARGRCQLMPGLSLGASVPRVPQPDSSLLAGSAGGGAKPSVHPPKARGTE